MGRVCGHDTGRQREACHRSGGDQTAIAHLNLPYAQRPANLRGSSHSHNHTYITLPKRREVAGGVEGQGRGEATALTPGSGNRSSVRNEYLVTDVSPAIAGGRQCLLSHGLFWDYWPGSSRARSSIGAAAESFSTSFSESSER